MVELDGPQHFGPVSFDGRVYTNWDDQVIRDCAKNLWAWREGHSILRVSHREYASLNHILEAFVAQAMHEQVVRCSNSKLYMSIRTRSQKVNETSTLLRGSR